jgi:hypothetical protein
MNLQLKRFILQVVRQELVFYSWLNVVILVSCFNLLVLEECCVEWFPFNVHLSGKW